MVVDRTKQEDRMDRLFHALADPTRRDIVAQAMDGDLSVSALARRYPISLTAVQKHVAVLERAGLVTKHRHGKETRLHTRIETVQEAHRLLAELEGIWRSRIERFAQIAEDDHRPNHDKSNRGEANP